MSEGTWAPVPYRDARTPAMWAQGLLGLSAALSGLAVISVLQGFSLLEGAFAGSRRDVLALSEWISTLDSLGSLQVLLTVATAIAFVIWQYRAVANVPVLGGGTPRWSPGWSVAWWFIPIAFLFMPFLVIRDVLRRTSGTANDGTLVVMWWVAWIGGAVLSRLANSVPANTLGEGQRLVALLLASQILFLAAAIGALLIVRRIQESSSLRAQYLGLQPHSAANQRHQPVVAQDRDVATRMKELAHLREQGLITEEEFAAKRAELLTHL